MLNSVNLIGRLTTDPELRKTQSGVSIVSFAVAVDRDFGKKEEKKTDFISCQAWRNNAEYLDRYARRGDTIAVNGSVQVNSYKDRDGITRKATDIVAERVYIVKSSATTARQERPANAPGDWSDSAYGYDTADDLPSI